MIQFWESWALSKHPENMLTMLLTWQSGDCSAQPLYKGNLTLALNSIDAKAMVMPSKTDLYFPPEDSESEVECMQEGKGKLEVFDSVWGHWAGGPGQSAVDGEWLDKKLSEFFKE